MKELGPRVFVVDDDQSVRTSLATLLSAEDYAVERFASAAEYLARVPHPGPMCLVLDVQLPGLDVIALQQQLTQEGLPEQIVFITCCDHGTTEAANAALVARKILSTRLKLGYCTLVPYLERSLKSPSSR
jgi:FixJ family two-component response regulator